MEEMSYVFSFTFFSLPLIFTLHWWPLAFLIFSLQLQNCHVVLVSKKMSPLLFISRSRSLSPFFSLSVGGMPPTFSFSLSFSCSIFQFFGNDNLINLRFSAQINCHGQKFGEVLQYFRQHGYRNNFCFPFSSLLTL